MKSLFRYILILWSAYALMSCVSDEQFNAASGEELDGVVEFVARPVGYVKTYPATKADENVPEDVRQFENAIYTAYFLVYDCNGRLIRFENLTDDISNGDVPSQTIVTDKGLTNVTACYIANIPESFVLENMRATDDDGITDFQKLQSSVIELKTSSLQTFRLEDPEKSGYVGVPVIDVDDKRATENPQCMPMFGVWTGDLTGAKGKLPVEIPIKRLFAKVRFSINLAFKNEYSDAKLDLTSVVVNNIPERVFLYPQEEEDEKFVYSSSSNFFSKYNQVPIDNVSINNHETFTFFLYVPEYIVNPVAEAVEANKYNTWYIEEDQKYKPELIGSKKATYVNIKADLTNQGQKLTIGYNIYLGENNFDDFSLKRNYLYDNSITIEGFANGNGAIGTDHRVSVTYDGFLVGFQRATLLDSHYEVRPLRVKFSPDLIAKNAEKNTDVKDGTVTVEILKSDDGTMPEWLRLERPSINSGNAHLYCPANEPYPTKRKYFTTDLVTESLKDNVKISYNPFASDGDLTGNVPIWVYVDEYLTSSTGDYAVDDVRIATIRVTYKPNDPNEPEVYHDYSVEQRAIYPIQSKNRNNQTYGIEFFEEYQHDYDANLEENYGAEGGVYHSDYDGLQWGLDGIRLSRNNKALYLDKAVATLGEGTDAQARTGFEETLSQMRDKVADYIIATVGSTNSFVNAIIRGIVSGISLPSSIANFTVKQLFQILLDEMMSPMVAKLPAYYDYYAAADDNTGILSNIDTREYEGYEMNVEIIHNLLEKLQAESTDEDLSKVLLNGFTLNKSNPLSAIAYCYNKNKRDENGNVVTLSGDDNQTVNIANLHWYAPCIEEIEDIISSAYQLEEEFSVFTEKFYWSCQPAYLLNKVEITYSADAIWRDMYISGLSQRLDKERRVVFNVEGSGPYYADDTGRARATRFDSDENAVISSSVDGIYAKLATHGSDDFGKIDGIVSQQFYITLASKIPDSEPTWNPANPEPKPTGAQLTHHEGNDARTETNRIRCIYNPNPPKTATRAAGEDGSFTYTYAN